MQVIWKWSGKLKKHSKNRNYGPSNQNNELNEPETLAELKWVIILSGTVDSFTTIKRFFAFSHDMRHERAHPPVLSVDMWRMLAATQLHVKPTWREEDDGHGDEGADHQDDQQSDGNPLPVPLRRTHPAQVLPREKREGKHGWVRVEKRKISLPSLSLTAAPSCPDNHKSKDCSCNVKSRIFVRRFVWLRIAHTARLLTAPINTGHTEALYFQSNLPAQRRIYNEGLCMSHTANLKSETRCFWFVFQCGKK